MSNCKCTYYKYTKYFPHGVRVKHWMTKFCTVKIFVPWNVNSFSKTAANTIKIFTVNALFQSQTDIFHSVFFIYVWDVYGFGRFRPSSKEFPVAETFHWQKRNAYKTLTVYQKDKKTLLKFPKLSIILEHPFYGHCFQQEKNTQLFNIHKVHNETTEYKGNEAPNWGWFWEEGWIMWKLDFTMTMDDILNNFDIFNMTWMKIRRVFEKNVAYVDTGHKN